ncbi:adenosine deaminase/editase, partial [Basidiobolus meristosporus CBS 931.73]
MSTFRCEEADFPDQLAQKCQEAFDALPKQGKPIVRGNKVEWTVLAGILMAKPKDGPGYELQCLSIGTGLKCLSSSKLPTNGDALHDSHAEIIARRGFIRYLLDQTLIVAKGGKSDILKIGDTDQKSGTPFELVSPDITFHMYVSHCPCGDASTTPLANEQSAESYESFKKRKTFDEAQKVAKSSEVVAKNVEEVSETAPPSGNNLKRGRVDYDRVNVLRTKPGRGDAEPTLSMSCSDKIARWNVLGLQSAMLSLLMPPIYLASITIGDLFDEESVIRALCTRVEGITDLPPSFHPQKIGVFHTKEPFRWSKGSLKLTNPESTLVPSPSAINWVLNQPKSEAIVNGRKQGARPGKDGKYPIKTRSALSKASLFGHFVDIVSQYPPSLTPDSLRSVDLAKLTYLQLKQSSARYSQAKDELLR